MWIQNLVLVSKSNSRSSYRVSCKLTILFKIHYGHFEPWVLPNSDYLCRIQIENFKGADKLGVIFEKDEFFTIKNILRYCRPNNQTSFLQSNTIIILINSSVLYPRRVSKSGLLPTVSSF
jgi:hypothetical protein